MDPENVGKETILKVTDWLRRIWEMRRRAGGPVQQWIDSIPSPAKSDVAIASECREDGSSEPTTEPKDIPFRTELKPPSMTVSAPVNVPNSPAMNAPILPSSLPHRLARDASFQSDSSRCSSVESLLELRRADPAAILLDLGFGGCSASPQENGPLSRIPNRFLQPSTLQGIAVDEFLKRQQQSSESFDSVSLGYRGLTGSPYVAPSEIVQKIMERLREHENHEADTSLCNYEQYSSLHQNGTFSVLSPDNRQFLEQPRSKSPDMRNKRMVIGQKSFTFGCDGNLIEIPSNTKLVSDDDSALGASESTKLKQSSSEESVRSEHCFPKNDTKFAKQLSFDETVAEFPDTDQLLKDNRQSSLNSLNIARNSINVDNNDQECNTSNTNPRRGKEQFPPCYSDIRRASDGSCDTKSLEDKMFDERRRFSDGAMRTVQSNELMQKRRSLKRQSRIRDTTAMHRSDPSPPASSSISNAIFEPSIDSKEEVSNDVIDSTRQLNIVTLFESIEHDDLEIKTDTVSSSNEPNCMPSSSNIGKSTDKMERFETIEEDPAPSDHSCAEDQVCCYKGKVCKDCKHSKKRPDSCCYAEKQRYLKKMQKIMEENKKLEDMLARNRREMAEIRDMLNSVLSVRMEPGF
ncbi:uncharacterized protein LOC105283043 isoform X2 [Ooceraea biroi]|nr:uncharacterized protein LOC105283043 isoform X2 [Ooceraea biroi]